VTLNVPQLPSSLLEGGLGKAKQMATQAPVPLDFSFIDQIGEQQASGQGEVDIKFVSQVATAWGMLGGFLAMLTGDENNSLEMPITPVLLAAFQQGQYPSAENIDEELIAAVQSGKMFLLVLNQWVKSLTGVHIRARDGFGVSIVSNLFEIKAIRGLLKKIAFPKGTPFKCPDCSDKFFRGSGVTCSDLTCRQNMCPNCANSAENNICSHH
jgi:hypothetical protein